MFAFEFDAHVLIGSGWLVQSTVRPLLSAVLGRTKFWSQKPQITEVCG